MAVKLLHVIGARPQFVKYFPIQQAMDNLRQKGVPFTSILVHTGQHYDYCMSQVFFDELGIRPPDYHLEAGSGNHGRQTALVLQRSEDVLIQEKPDIVVVYGDTNSTLGAALAAAKLHIPVAHIEAGLRSFNKTMPEEINRLVTDHVSTYLFCPSAAAMKNLHKEGFNTRHNESWPTNLNGLFQQENIDNPCIIQTGDVMYDLLLYALRIAEEKSTIVSCLNIEPKQYHLLTLHRAENTDDPDRLRDIIKFVKEVSAQRPVIFPMHPRMVKAYAENKECFSDNIRIIEPLGYFDLLSALKNAQCLLTDSGGMQKEAYWLQVPCVTLRDETEWVETVQAGWNILWQEYYNEHQPHGTTCAYGNGCAAQTIINILLQRRFTKYE